MLVFLDRSQTDASPENLSKIPAENSVEVSQGKSIFAEIIEEPPKMKPVATNNGTFLYKRV